MVNEEKLKREIFIEIQSIANDCSCRYMQKIEKEFLQHLSELNKELQKEIKVIQEKYIKLEQLGQVGMLEWIYISFMRTGLIDNQPCYRIDFYDSRGCISDIECMGSWDFNYVFDFYYETMTQIVHRLNQQTRLKFHEIDTILYDLSDSFQDLSNSLMTQLLHAMRSDFIEMVSKGHRLRIMLGEFLDKAELVEDLEVGGDYV